MTVAQVDPFATSAPPIDVVEMQTEPRIGLADAFPQVSACKFCGSCAGCEHLVAVIDCDGRPVAVYGPGAEETRRRIWYALGRLLMMGSSPPHAGPHAVAGSAGARSC